MQFVHAILHKVLKNRKFYHKVYRWVLPFSCVLCHYLSTRQQDLCDACYHELPILTHSCFRCARVLSMETQNNAVVCGHCLTQPPPFTRVYASFAYQAGIKSLIQGLKFNEALVNARILGELLSEKIKIWYQNGMLPEVIIPIPLHAKRLKERGFNQALEIARVVSEMLQLPIDKTSCQRIKPTAAQATLPAAERQNNVKQAFQVSKQLSWHHVAVIDDVMTTGFTMIEFTHALKRQGVDKIDVWCVARVA